MSKIQWTDVTWNPTRGCSVVSPGCTNCYAMKQAHRFNRPGAAYEGLTQLTNGGPVWTGEVRLVPEKLDEPIRWRRPRRIFVDSMSDLFHEDIPDRFRLEVFVRMALAQRHTFQILTKRPYNMRRFLNWLCRSHDADELPAMERIINAATRVHDELPIGRRPTAAVEDLGESVTWPLPNVHLGISVEDQAAADERIPHLLQAPAALRFLSVEPLLSSIDLKMALETFRGTDPMLKRDPSPIQWVIVGGESGPKARPCDVAWIRSIRDQCAEAKVPLFVKQFGARAVLDGLRLPSASEREHSPFQHPKGGDPTEWPEDLRVREFPDEARERR